MTIPTVIIAAPTSNSGKTIISTGLIGALRKSGYTVAPFKVGPDFIDTGYHTLASCRPGRNLDPVLVGEDLIGKLYLHGCIGADIAIIEGLMGLFDGRIQKSMSSMPSGSTASIAYLLNVPIILVVDARNQSHSIAALLHGFLTLNLKLRIIGVILNKVNSRRHEYVLSQACKHAGIDILGVIPQDDNLSILSRYLGLITTVEQEQKAYDLVDIITNVVRRNIDLATIVARSSSHIVAKPWNPTNKCQVNIKVAFASGKAFSFVYPEYIELFHGTGIQVTTFDPMCELLPSEVNALIFPGGFPEQYTSRLYENKIVRQQIKKLANYGIPIHAECAGLTYLLDSINGTQMCGVLSGSARLTKSLNLGYRDALSIINSCIYATGQKITGHEFHRTKVIFSFNTSKPAWILSDKSQILKYDGKVNKNIHASYLHMHPAAYSKCIIRFISSAANYKN